jgi:hypothetical protein
MSGTDGQGRVVVPCNCLLHLYELLLLFPYAIVSYNKINFQEEMELVHLVHKSEEKHVKSFATG